MLPRLVSSAAALALIGQLVAFQFPGEVLATPPEVVTVRVSANSSGPEANNFSYSGDLAGDGSAVVFESRATNLVAGDSNGADDVFVFDRAVGALERVSVASDGTEANSSSWGPSVSSDGRYVTFTSAATNLVQGDANGVSDVFLHDRTEGTTRRVSVSSSGAEANGSSTANGVTADGARVVFSSTASNMVTGDTNNAQDVFVHNVASGDTRRVSTSTNGAQGTASSWGGSISGDGSQVGFVSSAANLVVGDLNAADDVFLHNLSTGSTRRVSVGTGGIEANGTSAAPSLSTTGNHVAFRSLASNLAVGDLNGFRDIFVHDVTTAVTRLISVGSGGSAANGHSWTPSISANGRYVAFQSAASNLVAGDQNGYEDIFVRDWQSATTQLVSKTLTNGGINSHATYPSIAADGQLVSYGSAASNIVSGDSNAQADVFLADRAPEPPIISLFAADLAAFSPNADELKDLVTFSFTVEEDLPPANWELRITNVYGNVVRTFGGRSEQNNASLSQSWDGIDSFGNLSPDGLYSAELEAEDSGGNAVVAVETVVLDTTPPVILPQSVLPSNGGNTVFGNQPLLAQIGEPPRGAGLEPDSIRFRLTNSNTGVTTTHASAARNPSTWWAKTDGIQLTAGHVYRIAVEATDSVGNAALFEQDQVAHGGGFLASSLELHDTSATIGEAACTVSGLVLADGTKQVTCEAPIVDLAATTATMGGSRASTERAYVTHSVPLGSSYLRTTSDTGQQLSAPAYGADTLAKVNMFFDVDEAFQGSSTFTSPAVSAPAPTLTTTVPSSWTSATLVMPAVVTDPISDACADPSVSQQSLRGVYCVPDPTSSRFLAKVNHEVADPGAALTDVVEAHDLEPLSEVPPELHFRSTLARAKSTFADSRIGTVVRLGQFDVIEGWAEGAPDTCRWRSLEVRTMALSGLAEAARTIRSGHQTSESGGSCQSWPAMLDVESNTTTGGGIDCPPQGFYYLTGSHTLQDKIWQDLAWHRDVVRVQVDCIAREQRWLATAGGLPPMTRSGHQFCWWREYNHDRAMFPDPFPAQWHANTTLQNISDFEWAFEHTAITRGWFQSRKEPVPWATGLDPCDIPAWAVMHEPGIDCDWYIGNLMWTYYDNAHWITYKDVEKGPNGGDGSACGTAHSSTDYHITIPTSQQGTNLPFWRGNLEDYCSELVPDDGDWPDDTERHDSDSCGTTDH